MASILLADDEPATRDLVRRALEMDGHAVDLAEDGSEALARFEASPGHYHLVITDVEMPGVDGVALAKKVLALSPTVRVLLMSGFTDALERGKWLGPARFGILAKPFTLEQIRRSIKTVLET